jgi:septum formation protein
MVHATETIVLASGSPRRAALLRRAGIAVRVVASGVPESVLPGEAPGDYVRRLAGAKAREVAGRSPGRFYLGADTVVVLDGTLLGKPSGAPEAAAMLRRLSGRAHEVITGFEIYDRAAGRGFVGTVSTDVWFRLLREPEIAAYVASGEPLDKAGAYAIQEGAASMVERITGSYTNVVGLPLAEVVETLVRCGAAVW